MYYYAPIHFTVKELVDPDTFSVLGDSSLWLFNPKALWTLDAIRKFFNAPVLVNNWASGGNFKYRGFRPSNCKVGATNSQHRLGNAFDFNCSCDYSSTEIQQDILVNPYRNCYKYITAIEKTPGWVHIDFRNHNKEKNGILTFDL